MLWRNVICRLAAREAASKRSGRQAAAEGSRRWASSDFQYPTPVPEPSFSKSGTSSPAAKSLTPKQTKAVLNRALDKTMESMSSKGRAQLLREKFGVDGSDDATAAQHTARRMAQILTMPLEGPTPLIRQKVELFTTDVDEFFSKYSRDEKSYNTFILGLAERGLAQEARMALEDMKKHKIKPNVYHYTSLMKTCVLEKNPDNALKILEEMKSKGIQPTVWTIDVVLESCVAAGQLDRAYELYDLCKAHNITPNAEIFTSLIKGCLAIDKDYTRAWETFNHMRVYHSEPDVVCYTLMIHICAKEEKVEKALNLLDEMRAMDIRPTDVTYTSLIYACARRLDYYDEAFKLLEEMKSEGFVPSMITLTNILNVCSKSGDVQTAELTFDEIVRTDEGKSSEIAHALMIEAYANAMFLRGEKDTSNELIASGEKIWQRMLDAGIKPTNYSYHNRLRLYTQSYRLNQAIELKGEMSKWGLAPTTYTYNLLIRMFSQARRVERAFDQFNIMRAVDKLEPNKATYVDLVVGCTKQFYVQSGMKLLREMKSKDLLIGDAQAQWVNDFRRQLVKFPWMIREIDEMTGKADIPVAPWRYPGVKRKIRYYRELTPEEEKRSPLFR